MGKASVRVITTETRLSPCQTERQGLELQKNLSLTLRVQRPRRASGVLLALEVLRCDLIEKFTEFFYFRLLGLVFPHADDCVEGALPQFRDVDPLDGHPELLHDVLEEVVGHRPLRDDALEGEGDRGGLDGADPDREEAATIALF